MNKTEMVCVLVVLTSILCDKMQTAADPPSPPLALRATLIQRGHNIQPPNVNTVRNFTRQSLQNFRGLVNYGTNGSKYALSSQTESQGTHLYIPGVSHLVRSLRNIAEEQRKRCQGESQVQQSKELQPPSHPSHQSQVEMSEIAKIQTPSRQGYFSKINFNDLLCQD